MNFHKNTIAAFLAIISATSCAISPPPKFTIESQPDDYRQLKDYMSWFIQREMKKQKSVGMSVALVEGDRVIWQQGFGYADKAQKIKSTAETIYRAGSISKLFNAIGIMQMVEQGKMEIDQPLVTYLPEFQIKSRFGTTAGITPRTIMNHHSGLPGDWIDNMWSTQPYPFTRLVQEIKDEYVAYPPNTVLSYSNLGVSLLGHALQNVSGTAYSNYIDSKLLHPLGMTKSRFQREIAGIHAAKSYSKGKEVVEYPLNELPAGGLNTSVAELSKFAVMINNKGFSPETQQQIISQESLEQMLTVQNADIPLDAGTQVGLGWFIFDKTLHGKERVYGHDGGTIAHMSSFLIAPESGLAAIVMANSEATNANAIANKMLQLAWSTKNAQLLLDSQATQTKINEEINFPGFYASLLGKVKIEEKPNGNLFAEMAGHSFQLKLNKNQKYQLHYKLFGLLPVNIPDLNEIELYTENIAGNHVIIGESPTERMLAAVRVHPTPVSKAWKKRLGHYQIINQPEPERFQAKSLELKIEDDFLVFSTESFSGENIGYILQTVNDKEAILEGIGRGMRETLRVELDSQGNEILTRAGLRAQKL